MPLYEFEGKRPRIAASAFIHPQAVVIGDVEVGENCFIGALAVLRGDYGRIEVGSGTNIQEHCILHAEPESSAIIENDCLIGHGAIVHGPCIIRPNVTIGMGALVSSGCELKEKSFLAAGSVLPPRKIIGAGQLAMGNPAREVKEAGEFMLVYNQLGVKLYQELAERCHKGLKLIEE